MKDWIRKLTNIRKLLLPLGLLLVLVLFSISLFKNIAYPLIWNDEADTIMFAKRILQYGYPKVHGVKNVLNLVPHPDKQFGIKKGSDAFIFYTWGIYYFATIGTFLAEKVADLYLKTALLRIPFATIGFLGLIILVFSVGGVFNKRPQKILYYILFFFFELLSVSLVLHLRDARQPALSIFAEACVFFLYFQYNFFQRIIFPVYVGLMVFFLFLVFQTFYPAYFIFLITLGLDIIFITLTKNISSYKKKFKLFFKLILPLLISLLFIIPFLFFFETFSMVQKIAPIWQFSFKNYYKNILFVLRFFRKYEFLYLALIVKGLLLILWQTTTLKSLVVRQKMRISTFLTLFLTIYILIVAKSDYIFERYIIVLQPILTVIFLLDISTIFQLAPKKVKIYTLFFICIFLFNFFDRIHKINPLKGHTYELFHQYKGPLDFAIPYIKNNFKNPEDLIIATNYEEFSFMYYLDTRIMVGQKGYNLEKDIELEPDIIIQRKGWRGIYPETFELLLKKTEYKKISFPVYDYQVNNIPELYYPIFHLYKTRPAANLDEALEIYIKQSLFKI